MLKRKMLKRKYAKGVIVTQHGKANLHPSIQPNEFKEINDLVRARVNFLLQKLKHLFHLKFEITQ